MLTSPPKAMPAPAVMLTDPALCSDASPAEIFIVDSDVEPMDRPVKREMDDEDFNSIAPPNPLSASPVVI